jgi:putative transposase
VCCELVVDALLMAVWQRKPRQHVVVHSDRGTQYGSDESQRFWRAHWLKKSMSRRGDCYDKAVAKSFFSSLKKERIRRRISRTRVEARTDVSRSLLQSKVATQHIDLSGGLRGHPQQP